MAQLVKNLPVMWETWIQSLGWEDPLEKEKATHSSILAWRILVHGVAKSQTLSLLLVVIWVFFFFFFFGLTHGLQDLSPSTRD